MSRVGLVLVSHSRALAEAAAALAAEMVAGSAPEVRIAAGMPDGGFGTDAAAVASACEEVLDQVGTGEGHGVVVLTDLGSAVLSAEMALEFLADPDADVQLAAAPFVEGTLAAAVAAAGGADLATVLQQAGGALAPKVEQILGTEEAAPQPESPQEDETPVTREVRLVNATGLHARPAAQVADLAAHLSREDARDITVAVPGRAPVPASSPMALAALGTKGGDTVTVAARGPRAEEAVAALARLIEAGFGEAAEAGAATAEPATSAGRGGHRRGVGVSPGRVVGTVARMAAPLPAPDTTTRVEKAQREAEAQRIGTAAAAVAERLERRALATSGQAAEILSTTASLATDPSVLADAEDGVRHTGHTAAAAVWRSFGDAAEALRGVGGLTAERATDVLDVRARIVAELAGVAPPGLPERDRPYVLVAHDLAPADTVGIDAAGVLGVICAEGGPTSHTAILARTRGIPAVVGSNEVARLQDGDTVLLDGRTGEVIVDPDQEQSRSARTTPAERVVAQPLTGPVTTTDGTHVAVRANIGGARDVEAARSSGAEGVGLFRTEFLFLHRTDAPDVEEQAALYQEVLRGFEGQKVVLRTLDAGSDKPLPFLAIADEENPALGVRGLRTAWDHPEVLQTQLDAIARAARAVPATDVWVMAPMIATREEAGWFGSLVREAGLKTAGVMVETPAAAITAEDVMAEMDFVSIGTNDLTQYVMAADRLSSTLAHLNDPWQPAVLRSIAQVVAGAGSRQVGVCGEAASDPDVARVLVGLGVRSLSMNAAAVADVGSGLGQVSLARCQEAAAAAVGAGSAAAAREAAAAVFSGR